MAPWPWVTAQATGAASMSRPAAGRPARCRPTRGAVTPRRPACPRRWRPAAAARPRSLSIRGSRGRTGRGARRRGSRPRPRRAPGHAGHLTLGVAVLAVGAAGGRRSTGYTSYDVGPATKLPVIWRCAPPKEPARVSPNATAWTPGNCPPPPAAVIVACATTARAALGRTAARWSARTSRTRRCRSPAAVPGSHQRPARGPRPGQWLRRRRAQARCPPARPPGQCRSGRRPRQREGRSGRTARRCRSGRDRQRLPTSQAMICRCWPAPKCRAAAMR